MSDTDTKSKTKIYKNPDRKTTGNYKPYIPQYQIEGVEPQYHGGAVESSIKIAKPTALPLDNPRSKRAPFQQPYAEIMESPIGRGKGLVPNVGNNMEHTWSSVEGGELVDDLVDPDHPMIDNNELVTNEALGYQQGVMAKDVPLQFVPQNIEYEEDSKTEELSDYKKETDNEDFYSIISALEDDCFLLIVSGTALCSGPKEEIEEQARALVFGDHELCNENPIPIDDIIILKKAKVKVGLFLE